MRKLALRIAAVGLLLILLLAGYQYIPLLASSNDPLPPELADFPLPPSAHLVRWDEEQYDSGFIGGNLSFAVFMSEAELVDFYRRELEKRYWEKSWLGPSEPENLKFIYTVEHDRGDAPARFAELDISATPIGLTRVKIVITSLIFSGPEE